MSLTDHASMRAYWEGHLPVAARALRKGRGSDTAALLRQHCPEIARQLDGLRHQPEPLTLWGLSRNFDEFARKQIVAPAVVQAIGEMAGVPMEGEAVHAGLLHTYGYLFSLIETPFGFKRDRWVSLNLGERFGLPFDTFCPDPHEGSLLHNLTYFLWAIAFHDELFQRGTLRRLRAGTASSLVRFPFDRLQRWRIREQVVLESDDADEPDVVEIYTDIVLPPDAPEDPEQLLVYWLVDDEGDTRLITAFTVTADFVEEYLRQPMGRDVEISLRFNAYINGFGDAPRCGARSLLPKW